MEGPQPEAQGFSPWCLTARDLQRSLSLTPPPAATLSVLPIGSPMALRAKRRFSPASAGVENATAGAVSSFPAKAGELSHGTFRGLLYKPGQVSNSASARGALRRETCNVRCRSLLRLRLRCPFCQSARRWLSGQKGVFPRLRPEWKMRQQER